MRKETTIAGHQFEFTSESGKIIGITKQIIQNTTSYGGGGMVVDGSGFIAPPRIMTTNHSLDEFFLKINDREVPVKLFDYAIPLRNGHNVTLIWGSKVQSNNTHLLGVINHDTGYHYQIINNDNLLGLGLISNKADLNFIKGLLIFLIPGVGLFILIHLVLKKKIINSKIVKMVTSQIELELKRIVDEHSKAFIADCKLIDMKLE